MSGGAAQVEIELIEWPAVMALGTENGLQRCVWCWFVCSFFYLKSFLVNGNTPVEELATQVFAMVKAMEDRILEELNEQKDRISREYLGVPWLGKAPFTVSRKALKLVTRQYRLMLGAVKTNSNPNQTDLVPCTHQFTRRFGIPCSHELLRRHEAKKLQLEKEDFHPF